MIRNIPLKELERLERDANMTLARSASACKRAKAHKDKAFKTIGDATKHLVKPKGVANE